VDLGQTSVWHSKECAMKRVFASLISLSLALVSSACNFSSLTEPQKMSSAHDRIQPDGRIQGRMNQGAFRPLHHAPGRKHGG